MLLFDLSGGCALNIYKGKKDLSGVQAASSPMRRAFLLVGVGAFDDPLLSVVLHKAFSSGRSVSQETVEFTLQTSSMRCKKE